LGLDGILELLADQISAQREQRQRQTVAKSREGIEKVPARRERPARAKPQGETE